MKLNCVVFFLPIILLCIALKKITPTQSTINEDLNTHSLTESYHPDLKVFSSEENDVPIITFEVSSKESTYNKEINVIKIPLTCFNKKTRNALLKINEKTIRLLHFQVEKDDVKNAIHTIEAFFELEPAQNNIATFHQEVIKSIEQQRPLLKKKYSKENLLKNSS